MAMTATFLSLLLLSPRWAAERLAQQIPPLEWMLGSDVERSQAGDVIGADTYLKRAHHRLEVGRSHYVLCLLGGFAACAGNAYASTQLPRGTLGPVFWYYAFIAGVLATDQFRWAVRLPRIYVQPLTHAARLRVIAHAPASTPAMRDMAQLAADTAVRANIGLFLVGLGLLWEVLSGRAYVGHGLSHVERLALVDLGPLSVTTAIALYLTFVPQYWLSKIAARQRNRVLDELALSLPHGDPKELLSDDAQRAVGIYDSILSSSTATAEARVVARRLLAVVVVIAPQLLAVATKLLHLG